MIKHSKPVEDMSVAEKIAHFSKGGYLRIKTMLTPRDEAIERLAAERMRVCLTSGEHGRPCEWYADKLPDAETKKLAPKCRHCGCPLIWKTLDVQNSCPIRRW